jgi:predicted HTH transcriptional regulator
MELPTTWVYGEKVPFTESNTVEFKRVSIFSGLFVYTSSNSGLPKYKETLIGFLNSGGGYLFMGILDDGTILGVEDLTESNLDKLNLWVDSCFNCLVYTDGKPINPSKLSLRIQVFPVEGKNTHIVMIEAINKGLPLDIMTRSGTIIYRLNASNYKVCAEPVYRKSDVKGMITSIQLQMQSIIDEKHKAIQLLKDAHADEIYELKRGWLCPCSCLRSRRTY